MKYKHCPNCNETKPSSQFAQKQIYCKACRAYAVQHNDGKIGDTKYCPSCKQHKPWAAFGRSKSSYDLHQSWCYACRRADDVARRAAREAEAQAADNLHNFLPPRPLTPMQDLTRLIKYIVQAKHNEANL